MNRNYFYFTPFNLDENYAASIRAKYFYKELIKDANVDLVYGFRNPSLKFSLRGNESSNILRLISEFIVGIEISLKLLFKKYNLYILSSPSYITVLIIGLLLKLLKKKYVIDIRDIYPEVYFHSGLINENGILGKILKNYTLKLYKGAEKIICVTEGLKDIIKSYEKDLDVRLVYNGFDESLFYKDEKFNEFSIIFHGNLGKLQNIDLLINIANKLPRDIVIRVAGAGSEKEKIEKCTRIIFLGSLKNSEIAEIVRKSHLGLSFRKNGLLNETAMPVKVFEYIGAGIPVLLTPRSEAGVYLEENNLGCQFNNEEIDKIVEKIVEIKNEPFSVCSDLKFSRARQSEIFLRIIKEV